MSAAPKLSADTAQPRAAFSPILTNGKAIMTPDLWVQSLRADSRLPPNTRSRSITVRRESCRVQEHVPNSNSKSKSPVNAKKVNKKVAGPYPDSAESTRTSRSLDPPEKCSSICCNYLSHGLLRWGSHPKTLSKLRINDYVGILEQIARAEARHASYQKEISRLKRILAACPPPGQSVLSAREGKRTFRACKHACCDPGLCPPRASTEMLRLRRIIQQLQIRSREILQDLSLLLSPIRRLPPELLQMVFSFAVPDRFQLPLATQSTISAIQLAHVCSYWRTVALDTSQLWTTIFIPSYHQSSIALMQFYSSHAKTSPLTVHCHRSLARPSLRKLLAHMSHRWHDVHLTVENSAFEALEVVRRKVPLLKSLSIYNKSGRDGTQTNDVFESAPALRRVVLTTPVGHVWPFSFVLPWEQLTSLTLIPISLSVFAECIRNCPRLLYFHAFIIPRPGEAAQQLATAEPHHSRGHGTALRKLEMFGVACQDVLLAHTFPHLRSLTIALDGPLHPDFPAFLARAPHLEMLAVCNCDPDAASTADLLVLLLAAPALRMLHFRDWHTAVVTPRFETPLGAPPPAGDGPDPCDAVEPQSLAELGVERCAAFDEVELRRLIEMRGERNPYFDPYGIERARLLIEGVPFDAEAELDYLAYR